MSEDKNKGLLKIRFDKYLEENKHRKTPERYFVLNIISDSSKRFNANWIINEAKSRGIRISRATVYNTLSILVEAELIREHLIEDKRYYEYSPATQTHIRLICTKCGKIKDVKDNETTTFVNNKKHGRFLTSYSSIAIYGLCSSCLNAKRKASLKEKLIAKEEKIENRKKLLNNKKNK